MVGSKLKKDRMSKISYVLDLFTVVCKLSKTKEVLVCFNINAVIRFHNYISNQLPWRRSHIPGLFFPTPPKPACLFQPHTPHVVQSSERIREDKLQLLKCVFSIRCYMRRIQVGWMADVISSWIWFSVGTAKRAPLFVYAGSLTHPNGCGSTGRF